MKIFVVEDWAGNEMNWGTFKTFEAAWHEIMTRFESDEDRGEYYAVEKEVA